MTSGTWPVTFWAVAEPWPGPAWQQTFTALWPGYRSWYLREGAAARPSLESCQRALATHMPELLPTWHRLVELTGGADLPARMLSMHNPPAYLAGCSQAVHTAGRPALVRNYDYAPQLLDRIVAGTAFTGRRVLGMSDCLWGLVDGMNDAGLVASLAFGGRREVGTGFGIPLVIRYLLEVCDTAAQARAVLARLPVHMAYNVTVLDSHGDYFTAYLGPYRDARFVHLPYATNHQEQLDWPEQAHATHSVERAAALAALVESPDLDVLADRFLHPPLYSTTFELGFGTLYTAVYRPDDLSVEFRWPGSAWRHAIDTFASSEHEVLLGSSLASPTASGSTGML